MRKYLYLYVILFDGDMITTKTLIQEIAGTVNAYQNCIKSGNLDWVDKHKKHIEKLDKELPHGSGLDGNNYINIDECKDNKVVIYACYHHMNENGMYDGWTDHKLIITPSFNGIDIRITGQNRNDIKEYLNQVFYDCLMEMI